MTSSCEAGCRWPTNLRPKVPGRPSDSMLSDEESLIGGRKRTRKEKREEQTEMPLPLAIETDKKEQGRKITYWSLLQNNRPYRLYLLSYVANHLGDWMTYLAAYVLLV
jgi:hypothetical protein